MTGNKSLWPGLIILGLLVPAYAQTPANNSPSTRTSELPKVVLDFGGLSGDEDDADVTDPRLIYGGQLTLSADSLHGNLLRQQYKAVGHVRIHDADTTLTAKSFAFDGTQDTGAADDAQLVQRPFTINAPQINISPTAISAYRARFSTTPPGVRPDIEAYVGDLTLNPQKSHAIMHHVSLYVFHKRILTVRRITFEYGSDRAKARNQEFLPVVGVSSRYGPYVAYGGTLAAALHATYHVLLPTHQTPQIIITSQQTLIARHRAAPSATPSLLKEHDYLGAIRQFATAPQPPLPESDPLYFHDYLRNHNDIKPLKAPSAPGLTLDEVVSTHIESSGNRQSNLYVSRLPEVSLNGTLPISPVPHRPAPGDAAAFRKYLRHIVLVADASVAYGYFNELPSNIRAFRQRDSVGLTTQPLLIAPNTLFVPRVQVTTNYYSGQRSSYRFVQGGFQLNHYFTNRTDVGVQYLQAGTSGQSPFNFDVLDTSRELDLRGQMGNRKLTVGGQVRYDLVHGGIFDYEIALAPGLAGITPIFTYNFRSRAIGLGVDIPGLTF